MFCPQLFGGVRAYVPEEIGADGAPEVPVVRGSATVDVGVEEQTVLVVTPAASPPTISPEEMRRMFAVAREYGVDDDEMKGIARDIAGVDSRRDIPADMVQMVIAAIESAGGEGEAA